ncbi:MAG: prepilin-type N-terminal cleavage/methylation domain-containing protein [Candidatus Omnitrophica bacterium]|nr:prepilin-type N-terminal cleavage/methylation domain-containing protein [Candidatus Omnitrophota bacterium]
MRPAGRHGSRGLTFVELLVAVTIFAILGAGVVAMFAGGVRTWRTIHRVSDANQRRRAALYQLTEDWRNAVWVANTEPVFTEDELRFVTRAADPTRATRHRLGMVWVRYRLEEQRGTQALRREQAPFLPGVKEPKATYATTILERVKAWQVSYATLSADVEPTVSWAETWDAPELPRGVRIEVTAATAQGDETLTQVLVNPLGRLAQAL